MPVFRGRGDECRGGGLVEDEDVDSGIALYGEIAAVGSAGGESIALRTSLSSFCFPVTFEFASMLAPVYFSSCISRLATRSRSSLLNVELLLLYCMYSLEPV